MRIAFEFTRVSERASQCVEDRKKVSAVGLYLCVFNHDKELDGVEVGNYSEFGFLRFRIMELLEQGQPGTKYPTLMTHSDCDGEWSPVECERLKFEIEAISEDFRQLPPIEFSAEWQKQIANQLGLKPNCLYDSFIDVDGEPLLERLNRLCDVAIESGQPILFQ